MYSVHRKGDSSVAKASNFEVKPALGVAFVISALRIRGCPETVVIVGSSDRLVHIAGVKPAVEEDVWLAGLVEVKAVTLGYVGS